MDRLMKAGFAFALVLICLLTAPLALAEQAGEEPDTQVADIMRAYIPEGRQAEDFVFDEADIFNQREEEAIRSRAKTLFEQYRTNFIVLTVSDAVGSADDLAGYSEQFHNEKLGLGWEDCTVMLTIDMGLREYRVDFFGRSYHLLNSDEDTLPVTDGIYDYMVAGAYLDAYMVFCDKSLEWFDQYVAQQLSPSTTEGLLQPILTSLIFGLIATGVGMLVLVIINVSANSRKMRAANYIKTGSFHLDYAKDVFLRTYTSRVRKAENSSGGSGGARVGGSSSSRGSQRSF